VLKTWQKTSLGRSIFPMNLKKYRPRVYAAIAMCQTREVSYRYDRKDIDNRPLRGICILSSSPLSKSATPPSNHYSFPRKKRHADALRTYAYTPARSIIDSQAGNLQVQVQVHILSLTQKTSQPPSPAQTPPRPQPTDYSRSPTQPPQRPGQQQLPLQRQAQQHYTKES
jgi:hypothetical protein